MTEENVAPEAEGQVAEAAPEAEGQATSWFDSFDDETKGYIQNKGWDDPVKAVKSYQELEKFRGASEDQLLKLPKNLDEEGALDGIWNKLGRPESPDKYSVDFGEGVNVDSDRLGAYAETAHKLGITQKQFETLAKLDAEYMSSVMEQQQKAFEQKSNLEYEQLKKEWGANAAEREELSRRGLQALLPDNVNAQEVLDKIERSIGTATMLKLFANAGERLAKEDSLPNVNGERSYGYTREQAVADRKKLMSELSGDDSRLSVYNQAKGPDYDRMAYLNKIIAG